MAKNLTSEQRKRIAELLSGIREDLAEMRALLEKRLAERRH
ncbi:MAG: hypothetical protein QOG85_754 [Gaiellaceae bacterium]|jgi:hypothetical protein|nr:hypothetical protein [Gaiellaceae bacterium]